MNKIVFVTDTMVSGGAERVISVLANKLVDRSLEVEIICLRRHDVFYSLDKNITVSFADDHGKNWLEKVCWLRHHIKKDDVVIAFMTKVYCVVLLSVFGQSRHIICSERNDPRFTPFLWSFLRSCLLLKTSALVVQTDNIKSFFPKCIRRKTHIIYNPIDLYNCSNSPWSPGRKSFVAVGRLDKQKNYPLLLSAFAQFHQSHPDYVLEIWGGRGSDEQECEVKGMISSLHASEFILLKGLTSDMSSVYGNAYAYIASSDYEGLSNAIIEAMCSGIPVISTRVSGAVDIINDGENGILVDCGDQSSLVDAMSKCADDILFASALAVNALSVREMFSVESILNQWISVIKVVTTK